MVGQHDQGAYTGQNGGVAVVSTAHVIQQGGGDLGHVVTIGQGIGNLGNQWMINAHVNIVLTYKNVHNAIIY